MEEKYVFSYFYGNEAEMFAFYRVPKLLITSDYFRPLSSDAKLLYGLLLDRMSLSIKNNWMDKQNRSYIYYSIEDIMEALNCGRNKAIKSLQELDDETGIGLIEKRRQGMGKSNVIYVKNFVVATEVGNNSDKESIRESGAEVYNVNFKKSQKQTSRSPKCKLQEVCNRDLSYTKKSNTYSNDTESNHIFSAVIESNEMDAMQMSEAAIKENIEFDILCERYPYDRELLQELVDLIAETFCATGDFMVIAGNQYPESVVQDRLSKLNSTHIEYVLGCLQKNTTKVKNIKKYMLAVLFNAPVTIKGYFQAEVRHDMFI